MLTGSRSTGRSSPNTSMRSTSLTMRSASSQISRVSVRSSSPTDCSSSCAAPRMPDSGFLISWASMAASAITERAAPRWVSWRSILSAMVRSCSMTTTWPGRSGTGATCRSTSPLAGIARRAEVDLVFVDGAAALAHLLDQRQQRAAERHEVAQRMPAQQRHRNIEEVLRGHVGVGDLAVRADHHDGMRQRIEHGFGAADGSGRVAASGQAHAATLHAKAAKDSSRRRSVSRAVGRGQHVMPPSLARLLARLRGRGRGIERPAEMFARMLEADTLAMMKEHFVVEREDDVALGGKRRRGLLATCGEVARELAGKPRATLGAASDHHPVGAGARQRFPGARKAGDVAIDHHRYGDRGLDRAHRIPIGGAGIELAAGAAMHGDELHARRLRPPRQFRRIDGAIVPAEPHFQGYGNVDRGNGRVDQRDRMVEVPHQRRAGLAIGDMLGGAPHIDVDDLGALRGRNASALGHPPGFAACELHHMVADPRGFQPQPSIALSCSKRRAGRHFGDDETGAEPCRHAAERGIGNAGHGRQQHRIRKPHVPDHHGRCRKRRSEGHAKPLSCLDIRRSLMCIQFSQGNARCKCCSAIS